MELLQSDQVTWHVVPGNSALTALPVPGPPFQVTTSNPVALSTNPIPFALAKSGTVILPVEFFVSSDVEAFNGKFRVHFEIIDNDEVSKFVIESSVNTERFDSIGSMPAILGRTEYYFDDQPARYEIKYYRVKAILHNGDFHYSGVMKCSQAVEHKLELRVRQNPAKGSIQYEIQSAQPGIARIMIMSMDGRILKNSLMSISIGQTKSLLYVPFLATGNYFLVIQMGRERAVSRFALMN